MTLNAALFSSAKDDWSTPDELFASLNSEFGFDLDAAASPSNAKCPVYFCLETDGLTSDWASLARSVWCNPPYGRTIGQWVAKAFAESRKGATVVLLLPARTDTKWFHEYVHPVLVEHPGRVRFIKGRLKFGGSKNSAPFPSMVVVFKGES